MGYEFLTCIPLGQRRHDEYPGWGKFWQEVAFDDPDWLRERSHDWMVNVDAMVDSIIDASIPTDALRSLEHLWPSLELAEPFSYQNPDLWDNLTGSVKPPYEDGFYSATDAEVTHILKELWLSQEKRRDKPEAEDLELRLEAATQFVMELKYAALCTIWRFECLCSCACSSAGLSQKAHNRLRKELFAIAVHKLLRRVAKR